MQKQLEIDFAIAVLLSLPSIISSLGNARLNISQHSLVTGCSLNKYATHIIIQNLKAQETKPKLQGQRERNLIHNASIL